VKDRRLEALFTPADFEALNRRDLSATVCVVFDVLRATSSIVTALANGAEAIIPVAEIKEALELRKRDPELLLAGEREGVRIESSLTGSIGFDLGNSPREFIPEKVSGRRIAMTTTNGTRALRACANAQAILIGSFLNLTATALFLQRHIPEELLLVCSGTFEQAAYEDVLGAGALSDRLWHHYAAGAVADSAVMCREMFAAAKPDLAAGLGRSRNGRRLLSRPDLTDDVAFCARMDVCPIVAQLHKDGTVREFETSANQ
jgi:2-phosphosulfolactate phosphatase